MLKSLCLSAALLMMTGCQPAPEAEQSQDAVTSAAQASATPSAVPAAASEAPAPVSFLIGRWVSAADPETGFEPWLVFDVQKYYSDGNEEGAYFQLDGQTITYYSEHGNVTNKVLELSETRFVEETEDGIRTVWTKADL